LDAQRRWHDGCFGTNHNPKQTGENQMATYKMVFVAAALTLGWMGVAAVTFSSIATVPQSLATISHQKPARAPEAPKAAEAPPTSIAAAH
jgi:hypothetical protein